MPERFAVISFYQFIQPDGYILQFYTNRECRLFLRESTIKPVVHMEPALRRGWIMHTDPRFCFVSWTMLPQQEDGETIVHSFYYRPPPGAKDIWFYLIGEINGVDSPSTGPIMHLPLNPVTPIETKFQPAESLTFTSITWNEPYAFGFKCPDTPLLDGFQLPITGLNQPRKVTIRFYDTEPEYHRPNNILQETTFLFIPDKRVSPNHGELYFPIFPTLVTPGEYYAISLWGDPAYPDTPTVAWEWNNVAPTDPTEWEFRWRKLNDEWAWYIYTFRYFGYRSWRNMPFYQPGVPTLVQIPA